ncbi:hypothetical protein FRC20_000748 [Serendipita sp. 405]|nr:hypothetical protein FRC15_003229 [Serendipita sp. 397]KAG8855557.1 hypothetical protein FRC20_000748 [Serendipita sp. 405]
MLGGSRMGLGMRPTQPVYTNSPVSNTPPGQQLTLFVGSISPGIMDNFLQALFSACGPLRSFKRLLTPIGKPQGFGFAEFEQPESMLRAIELLNGLELPSQEAGQPSKTLLVRADEKTGNYLKAYSSSRIKTDDDDLQTETARTIVGGLVEGLRTGQPLPEFNQDGDQQNMVPSHLHDLEESELPENQRGLVISEIELFRKRAVKKGGADKTAGVGPVNAAGGTTGVGAAAQSRERAWNQRQNGPNNPPHAPGTPSHQRDRSESSASKGPDPQSYNRAPEFVKSELGRKTDEDRDRDLRAKKNKADEQEFRHRERLWESAEYKRIKRFSHMAAVESAVQENEDKDRQDMKHRLEIWDDDESDELFYVDRSEWRRKRQRVLARETAEDAHARNLARAEEERVERESQMFLEKQMEQIRAVQEEQRRAGLLVDDAAPIKLSVLGSKASSAPSGVQNSQSTESRVVFGQEDEEEVIVKKKRVPLVELDFIVDGEKAKEKLETLRTQVTRDKDVLWKAKIRWEAISDAVIDKKLEPLIHRKIEEYLGDVDDDLVMFLIEHLKDRKPPGKMVEGLEPVLEDEAIPFVVAIWRQVVFESVAYGEALETGLLLVD